MLELPAASERSEQADHEPVDVEHRERVREAILRGPLPDLGERVEVARDRPARDLDALGRAGRARGVHHERDVVVGEVVGERLVAGRPVRAVNVGAGEVVQLRRRVDALPGEKPLGGAVVEDVAELAGAEPGVDRDDRDAGGERPDDRDRELERGLGPDRDAAGSV